MIDTTLISFAGCVVAELGIVSVCIAFNKFERWRGVRSMSLKIARGEFVREKRKQRGV